MLKETRMLPYHNRLPMITEVDRMFDEVFDSFFSHGRHRKGRNYRYPKVNEIEYNDRTEIVAGIPGLSEKDVSVEVKDDILYIKADKQESRNETHGRVVCRELKWSGFCRPYILGDQFKVDEITATVKDGLLTVVLPLKEERIDHSRVIDVRSQ